MSPQHDPQLYLSAVQALYGSYWGWAAAEAAAGRGWPPLVVNTHGWVKGLGFDLLTQLLRLVAPTHAVQVCVWGSVEVWGVRRVGMPWLGNGKQRMDPKLPPVPARWLYW